MSGPYDGQRRHLVSGPQLTLTPPQPSPGAAKPSSPGPLGAAPTAGGSISTSDAGRDGGEPAASERPGLANRSLTGSSAAILYDLHQQQQQQQQSQQQQQQQQARQLQQSQPQHAQSQSQCGPAVAYPQVAFPAVPPYIRQQSAMQFCFSHNPDKPPLSKTFSLPHDYDSQKPLGYKPLATAAEAAFGGVFPTSATVTRKSDGISCPNLGRRPEVSYRKDKMATSEETQSLLSELVSEEDSSYSLFDITGPSGQARFPWQRDVGVQTDLAPSVQSGFWPLSGLDGGRGPGPGPGPWKPDTHASSGGKCVLQNPTTMKRSSISMQEGLCLEVPPFEGVSVSTPALHQQDPWTSLEHMPDHGNLTSAHGTECRLYCSLHNTEKSYRCPDSSKEEPSENKRLLRPTNLG